MTLNIRSRGQRGTVSVLTIVVAFMIILPIGCVAFEIGRVQLAQKQLRAATDAAALAAADFLDRTTLPAAQADIEAQRIALNIFRLNTTLAGSLNPAIAAADTDTVQHTAGNSSLNIIISRTNNIRVTARAALGVAPAFAFFLRLGDATVRANSLAGRTGLDGEAVIVFDLSKSMGFTTPVEQIIRVENRDVKKFENRNYNGFGTGHRLDYYVLKQRAPYINLWNDYKTRTFPNHNGKKNVVLTAANPTIEPEEYETYKKTESFLMPDPSDMNLLGGKILKNVTVTDASGNNAPITDSRQRRALMVEAKFRNLESEYQFIHSGAKDMFQRVGITNFTPHPGYFEDYFRVAVASTHPYIDAALTIQSFIGEAGKNRNLHFGLIGFNRQPAKLASTPDAGHLTIPRVDLSPDSQNINEITPALEFATLRFGTNTAGAIHEGVKMLKANGRKGQQRNLILLTDGQPNMHNVDGKFFPYLEAAQEAKDEKVKIHAIGFFHTAAARVTGNLVLEQIVDRAQNGSKFYRFPPIIRSDEDVVDSAFSRAFLQQVFTRIAQDGPVTLLND